MTTDELKEKLLDKMASLVADDNLERLERYGNIFSQLAHAEMQTKMTDASIHGANPFGGIPGDFDN